MLVTAMFWVLCKLLIRSLGHYAIFERSTANAAKTPQRKALPLCNSAADHKGTRNGDYVSTNTVAAIREQEWQQVAARKERIAAQCELNAILAAESMTHKLQTTGAIPLNILVPVFGVSADKLALLRGQAPSVNI